MRIEVKVFAALLLLGLIAMLSIGVFAAPEGPSNILRSASERSGRANNSPVLQQAFAGNTTALDVNVTTITKRWQGYYGNISGTIVLDDANNNSLYQWDLASVQGEIYASNGSSVTWGNVDCINYTADESSGPAYKYNLSIMNHYIGLGSDTQQAQADSINGTFNGTFGDDGTTLTVGTVTLNNADNCSLVTLNNNNGAQSSDFQEIILTDNESIIFTAIIEEGTTGFQGHATDFQMIVGVNGSDSTATNAVLNYYFYVELS